MPRKARTILPSAPLLVAQNAALTREDRIDTLMLSAVSRKAPGIDIGDALQSAKVTLTIEGASQLDLTITDPDWVIEDSGLLDKDSNGRLDQVVVSVDNIRFRLAKASRQDIAVTLTFEDEVWALMRAHRSFVAVSRASMTRAQFIERKLLGEIKLRDVPFWSPEKGRKQPQELPDFPDITPETQQDSSGTTKAYTETTWAAALLASLGIDQRPENMQAIIGWEKAEGGHWANTAKFNPLNTTQKPKSGGFTDTGTQGNIKSFTSWKQGLQTTVETLHNGRYGAILRALKNGSVSDIAQAIASTPWNPGGYPNLLRAMKAAPSGLHDVNGGGGGTSGDNSETHEAVRVKQYRFTRGLPGQTENSAQAATRLADEVAWRFFISGGVAWFVTDYYLLTLPASFILEGFDDAGVLTRPDYEWDHRKLAANVSFTAVADAWSVRPGAIVAWRDVPEPIVGRWIVQEVDFDLLNPFGCEITLTKPTAPKKEPAPELFVVNVGDGTAGGEADAGTPGAGSAAKTIKWAEGRIGHYAEEFGNNRGAELDALEKKFGFTGAPWCAIFATTALVMGGVPRACRTAAVAQINAWCAAGTHGYQKGFRATPKPGDLVTFGSAHVGLVEKVVGSSVHTIEGNTGANKVARRQHALGDGTYVRPQYPED